MISIPAASSARHPLRDWRRLPLDGGGERSERGGGARAGGAGEASRGSAGNVGGPHPLSHAARDSSPIEGERGAYAFDVPLLAGDHVTDDAGTGFVHTAPGHGADDFVIWTKHFGQEGIPFTVDADGKFTNEAPGFEGLEIIQTEGKHIGKDGPANKAVIDALIEAGALLARGQLKHQYPHSWRSKAPLIFRNTPQWFIALDKPYAAGGGKTLAPSRAGGNRARRLGPAPHRR